MTIGWLLAFLSPIALVSAMLHVVLRWRIIVASIISAAVATLIFQIANFAMIGYLDPFMPIAVAVELPAYFMISCAIGVIIRLVRDRANATRQST